MKRPGRGERKVKIKNNSDLQKAYQDKVLDSFFITADAESIIKKSLEDKVKLLVDAYGENGEGGYIKIIRQNISTQEGMKEYMDVLSKYNLIPDMWELDDVLVCSESKEIHLQLFAVTEFNLVIMYLMNGG